MSIRSERTPTILVLVQWHRCEHLFIQLKWIHARIDQKAICTTNWLSRTCDVDQHVECRPLCHFAFLISVIKFADLHALIYLVIIWKLVTEKKIMQNYLRHQKRVRLNIQYWHRIQRQHVNHMIVAVGVALLQHSNIQLSKKKKKFTTNRTDHAQQFGRKHCTQKTLTGVTGPLPLFFSLFRIFSASLCYLWPVAVEII